MKTKKLIIISIFIIAAAAIVIRLFMNKQSLQSELDSISKFSSVIPVVVDTVKNKDVETGFTINGSFSPISEVSIASETMGTIKEINVQAGDYVKKNQTLAVTDNKLIISQLELAKANYEKTEKDMKRFEQLSKEDAASLQQSESARLAFINAKSEYTAAEKNYNNSIITSPVNGTITKRYIETGSYIAPGTLTFDIVETNKLKFIAKLTSEQIAGIKKNDVVKLVVDEFPDTDFSGKVSSVIIKADDSKRYDVEIEILNNKEKLIKPGMFGTAVFKNNSQNQSLIILRKSLSGSIKDPQVFVVKGDSVLQKNIIVESINDKYLLVRKGLCAGDVIVVSGQINLRTGSKVKIN